MARLLTGFLPLLVLLYGSRAQEDIDPTQIAAPPCTRDALRKIAQNYVNGAPAFPDIETIIDVSIGARTTQNNAFRANPLDTILSNIVSFPTDFKVQVIDTSSCNVATLYAPQQYMEGEEEAPDGVILAVPKNVSSIVSVRIKMDPRFNNILELEILNALPGSFPIYDPDSLPSRAPPGWTENLSNFSSTNTSTLTSATTTNSSEPQIFQSEEIIATANTYPSTIESSNTTLKTTESCKTYQNGVPQPCNKILTNKSQYPVIGRRWLVDEVTGITLGMYFLDETKTLGYGAQNVQVHEYFKVGPDLASQSFSAGTFDQMNGGRINSSGENQTNKVKEDLKIQGIFSVLYQFDGQILDRWTGMVGSSPPSPPLLLPSSDGNGSGNATVIVKGVMKGVVSKLWSA